MVGVKSYNLTFPRVMIIESIAYLIVKQIKDLKVFFKMGIEYLATVSESKLANFSFKVLRNLLLRISSNSDKSLFFTGIIGFSCYFKPSLFSAKHPLAEFFTKPGIRK